MNDADETSDLTHLFKPAPNAEEAIDMTGAAHPPEHYAETCRHALWNWGLRLMHGKKFPQGTRDWKSNEDALQAWNKALKYWEGKAKDGEKTSV